MPARVSYTAIACVSVGDATTLAASLTSNWTGPGPKPDLIEANGAEVDLTWMTQRSVPPVAAISAAKSSTGTRVRSFTHNDGNTTTSGN